MQLFPSVLFLLLAYFCAGSISRDLIPTLPHTAECAAPGWAGQRGHFLGPLMGNRLGAELLWTIPPCWLHLPTGISLLYPLALLTASWHMKLKHPGAFGAGDMKGLQSFIAISAEALQDLWFF